jgi:hypothetical protein
VNVRRLLVFVKQSIDRGMQRGVFERNPDLAWTGTTPTYSAGRQVLNLPAGLVVPDSSSPACVRYDELRSAPRLLTRSSAAA